jgi:DNA-binding SARP family transcriptional activator
VLTVSALGPLVVARGGAILPLGGPREKTLLSLLLIRRAPGVGLENMIDELWQGAPPASARQSVRSYVTRVRRSLDVAGAPSVVVWTASGYALRDGAYSSDVADFELTAIQARRSSSPQERADRLREALSLWRGRPHADATPTPLVVADAVRLEELRLKCLEDRLDADTELGLHREILPELLSLAAQHPLRESFCRSLALALYRSGREAEALRTIHLHRTYLRENLGIEPGRRLTSLEHLMLVRDARLDWFPADDRRRPRRPRLLDGGDAGPDVRALDKGRELLSEGKFTRAGEVFAAGLARSDPPLDRVGRKLSCELLLGLAEARLAGRDLAGGRAAAIAAADFAKSDRLSSQLAAAAVWASTGLHATQLDAGIEALCRDALVALGPHERAERAMVLTALANYQSFVLGQGETAMETAAEALEIANSCGEPTVIARCLLQCGEALDWSPRISERMLVAEQLIAHGAEHGDRLAQCDGIHLRALARLALGDLAGFDEDRRRLAALSPGFPTWYRHFFLWLWDGTRALIRGDFAAVEVALGALFAAGGEEPNIQNLAAGQLVMLNRDAGRLARLRPHIERQAVQMPRATAYTCALALASAEAGDHDTAEGLLRSLLDGSTVQVPRDLTFLASLCLLAETALTVGDHRTAKVLLQELLPYRGQVAVYCKGIAADGAVDSYIASLQALLGDEAARGGFEAAIRLEDALGAPVPAARTRDRFARWLCSRPSEVDRRRGAAMLAGARLAGEARTPASGSRSSGLD